MSALSDTSAGRVQWRVPRRVSVAEVMLGIAILTILIQVATPSFADFVSRTRLASSVATLVADINYARGEAISRNAQVIVCAKAANSAECATTPNWQAGWIVCVDANADNVCDGAGTPSPNPMRVRHAVSSATVITAGAAVLRFGPAGSSSEDGAFTIAGGPAASPSRTIRVAANGTVRTF